MANLVRNFIKGRMNKSVDERLVPEGEYIHAQNIRMGSTEESEVGSIENTKGNEQLTTLVYPALPDQPLSGGVCIGSYADGANETIYWFVHYPNYAAAGATGKLDMIVSYNTRTDTLLYHVVSIDDGGGQNTTLNFDERNLITGVDLVEDLLLFTDDLNPPRRINIKKAYPQPTANVDDPLLGDDILVIKAPPVAPPDIYDVEQRDAEQLYGGAAHLLCVSLPIRGERVLCYHSVYRARFRTQGVQLLARVAAQRWHEERHQQL